MARCRGVAKREPHSGTVSSLGDASRGPRVVIVIAMISMKLNCRAQVERGFVTYRYEAAVRREPL
ncbi:hypothetical protein DZC73_25405 [Albitalea terrae]|uniref:Uncharacterized protein n=1 Tax=Piscinibacter terrae TaxID=2496871 RepID=A0A3N7HIC2_9BURK|nr:hypothetical protein DZC73_25405 [Albitalea terrae]